MAFGNFDAVAHDVNDFGDVPNQIVIIRAKTVAQTVLKPHPKFKADFLLCIFVIVRGVERLVWKFVFDVF